MPTAIASKPHVSDRAGYLAGHAIVNGILAADCLYDEDVPMNDQKFLAELTAFIKSQVSPSQCENLVAVLHHCQEDESWAPHKRF
jgi:hypothetical protein